ncbi:AMP-binding protein [Dyadobacter sandarakinus]|uniref:AMP-binding protein n=1 Tax=Dyadobacter sandarakinus TaxID=2747268 RepID=A0ABX7I335_9BACT|nr:AMP-binding protein [Dyadobacter sandarakinus]QRQ99921.1 AMP-binding protein [Dyadobacter sandarakinus]
MNWTTSIHVIGEQPRPAHPYFAQAYDFMQKWRSGQQRFELQTSGSTGLPKKIIIRRSQLVASAAMTGTALGLGKGTKALVCLNTGYIAGLMMLVRGMELGWELMIVEPAGNPFEQVPDSSSFDFIAMVPMQLSTCLDNSLLQDHIQRTGKILLGGAPVSIALQSRVRTLSVPVYQSYGMTETVSHVALRRLNGAEAEDSYTFLPGIRFGTDERGCLFVEGDVTNNERVQTNDLVEISGNTFRWTGRADQVINSGGVKIVLDHIDNTLAQILEALAFHGPFFSWYVEDEKLGQKLVLVIEGQSDAALETAVYRAAADKLHAYEVPKHTYFTPRFSKTPTDKVDKRATINQILKALHG